MVGHNHLPSRLSVATFDDCLSVRLSEKPLRRNTRITSFALQVG